MRWLYSHKFYFCSNANVLDFTMRMTMTTTTAVATSVAQMKSTCCGFIRVYVINTWWLATVAAAATVVMVSLWYLSYKCAYDKCMAFKCSLVTNYFTNFCVTYVKICRNTCPIHIINCVCVNQKIIVSWKKKFFLIQHTHAHANTCT